MASVRNFNNRRTVKKTDASIASRGSHSFHLKVWDGAISFSFNEFNIFTGAVPRPRGGSLGPQLGLGIHRSVRSGFVVYENLELRLLTEQPEEITDAMVEEAGIGPR